MKFHLFMKLTLESIKLIPITSISCKELENFDV